LLIYPVYCISGSIARKKQKRRGNGYKESLYIASERSVVDRNEKPVYDVIEYAQEYSQNK